MKKFIKKLLILTVVVAMVVTAMPLTGIDFSDIFSLKADAARLPSGTYGDFKYRYFNGELRIDKYYGNETEIVIPSHIDGIPVEIINSSCFRGSTAEDASEEEIACAKIKSVVIPGTVKRINKDAFKGCVSLEKITFNEGLENIYQSAFEGCTNLTEITLPQSLTYIHGSALNGTGVEELVLPKFASEIKYSDYAQTNIKRIVLNGFASITYLNSTNDITEEIIVEGFLSEPFVVTKNEGVTNNALKRIVCKGGLEISAQTEFESYGLYAHYEDDGSVVFTRTANKLYEETINSGDYEYALTNKNTAVIIRYKGSDSEITVPETIDGFTVTEIADYAFSSNDGYIRGCLESVIDKNQIISVTLPSSVNKIGIFSFAFNSAMKTLNLPEGVTEIPYAAVCNASSLESITLPASVNRIGHTAFYTCSSLKEIEMSNVKEIGSFSFLYSGLLSVDLPQGLEKIGNYAFGYSPELISVNIPDSVTQLGYCSFSDCYALENLRLSNNISKIPYACFFDCNIKDLVIPESVIEVDDYAFAYCILESLVLSSNLKRVGMEAFSDSLDDYGVNDNTLIIPESVEYIGCFAFLSSGFDKIVINGTNLVIAEKAFSGSGFSKLEIKSGVKEIDSQVFYDCNNLTELTMENGLERIDDEAFSLCNNLKEVTIPRSVNYLGKKVFVPCESIEKIVYNATDCLIAVTDSAEMPFDGTTVSELQLGDGITKIPKDLFSHFVKITELTIPDSVTEIEEFAFYYCINLENLKLSKNLQIVRDSAFHECNSLKELNLPEAIQIIEGWAFGGALITSLTLPKGLKKLDYLAFGGCDDLTEINYYPESCEFVNPWKSAADGIYYSPFYELPNLKTINIGENIKELPAYLFCGIETIDEIVLPSTVTDVGVGAFAFSSITSFKASDNLESVEESAFYGCKNLESVDIGNNIMLVGAGAFTGCDKLTEIYIPDTVTNIEMEAFKNCSALHTVRMSPNVDYIPREAFYNCKELSAFTWDAESKLVGRLAFGNCVKLTDFDFMNVEKLYVNSFLGSGVNVVQLGETENESSRTPLTTVEVQSFMDCDNLATLGIGGNVTTIKTQAFANCENLETAVIADSVTEIADDAFDGCDKLTIYCAENSYAHSYAQTQGIRVSTFVIAPIPNQTYTGFEIKPEISVSASGDKLAENVDFGVTYANNINVGNADVTVKGKGDFRMFASNAKFTIVTKNISAVTVSPVADQPYTGSAVTPEITVTDGIKVLREGTDYTVTYANNVNEGTATATITGKGNYSGTTTTSFQISKEAEEPGFFAKIFSSISSFFARVISFFASIFM